MSALIRENEQSIHDGHFTCSMIFRLVAGSIICLFKETYFTLSAVTFTQT